MSGNGGAAAAAVPPTPVQYAIHNYGGWCIELCASSFGCVYYDPMFSGWTVVPPGVSAYATTEKVPPVPAGGAVDLR
jgi:hypothetical protein